MSESSPLPANQDPGQDGSERGASQSDDSRPDALTSDLTTESRKEVVGAYDRGPRRATVGLIFEFIGLGAAVYLLITLFQEPWIVAQTKHWILLGVSGLSIVGFLLCVSAMFRQSRDVAVLGVWLGILASIGTAVCGTMLLASALELWGTRPTADMITATDNLLDEVREEFEDFMMRSANTPSVAEAEQILDGRLDAWGMPLRYQRIDQYEYEILSAGPNQTFDDTDDLRRTRF